MKKEVVVETLKKPMGKRDIVGISQMMNDTGFDVKVLMDLTVHIDPQVAFRAAWILENYYTGFPQKLLPALPLFLEKIHHLHHHAVQRHYAKILALMTHKNAPTKIKVSLSQMPLESVVETVFSWLISETVPVAVKSHCLNILANFSNRYDWIAEELRQTMDFLIDKESIAFYAKVKQIRKQLNRMSAH